VGDNCVLCGIKASKGGYTNRVHGRLLWPLCSKCDDICSKAPETVVRNYPQLFDSRGKTHLTDETSTTQNVATPPNFEPPELPHSEPPKLEFAPFRPTPPNASAGIIQSLSSRYKDGYTAAHAVVTCGKIIKSIAEILFVVILFIGLFVAWYAFLEKGGLVAGGLVAFIAAALACLISVPTYICGILVSSQGQIQLATLDVAVNSSRHLNDGEVADILAKRFSL
jgi:hypothetical protein